MNSQEQFSNQWSFAELQMISQREAVKFSSWDHDNGKPVPVDPPEHDQDWSTRLIRKLPEAAAWFTTPRIPTQLTYSTAILNVDALADDQKAQHKQKLLKDDANRTAQILSVMESKVKLLTDDGKPICIVNMQITWKAGTRYDKLTKKRIPFEVKSVYRGDMFTQVPAEMPQALIDFAEKKSGRIVEAKLYLNRDSKYTSGQNIFWHMNYITQERDVHPSKLEQLKLMLR